MTMVLLVHEKKLLKTCFLIYEILGNVGGYLLGEVLCIDMKCLEIFEVIIRGGIVHWYITNVQILC
jgi:hypothetical protein